MKTSIKFLFVLLFGLSFNQAFAQNGEKNRSSSVEQNAEFPGGIDAFYQYLATQLNYSENNNGLGIQGKLVCSFVVEKDGSIKDVKVVTSFAQGYDEDVIKVLNESPKWTPAMQGGQPVSQKMSVPIFIPLG